MKYLTEFLCLLLVTYCAARPVKDHDWDHFVFALEWPQSICWDLYETSGEKCQLPDKTNFWTIHGLWPTYQASHGPAHCTDNKFNETLIATIEDDLSINWPNLMPDTGKYSFWKHEWEKHGTCAMSMEELNSELKFFTKVLEVHKNYDILSLLEEAGIKPSTTALQYDDLSEAFEEALGAKAKLLCYHPKSEPVQHLGQIEFCLDTSFQTIECPHHKHSDEYESASLFDTLKKGTKTNGQVWRMEIPSRNQRNMTAEFDLIRTEKVFQSQNKPK